MADYFPVLSRAIAGLENNTGEARRAVYERARAAIVRQLRAIEPPLSEEDISRERMQLEEAIRKIEANAGGAPAAPAQPRPQPPAAANAPAKPAGPEAPRVGAPEAAAVASGPAPAAKGPAKAPEARPGPAPAQSRPAARADGRPIIQVGGAAKQASGSKRSGPLVALAALAVIAVGAGLFAARGHIAGLFGGGSSTPQQEAAAPSGQAKPEEQAATEPAANGKSDDRLPQDGAPAAPAADGGAASPPAQQPPPEQEVARAPDATAPQPAPAAQPAQPTESAQPAPSQSGPLVAQRAVLYEEGPNQQSGEAVSGTVTWRTESVSGGPNQPLETALRGDVEIPGRNLRATITIRRNADATLPASHTIEIQFTLPEDFPNAGVANVPGVLMKADEAARGAAVSGLSVRVTSGFFLIGLSNVETERSVNEQLLRDRGWIDIPILYDNGRRAVLTLEKGTPGTQAFQDAFSAWRSASASAPAPAAP